MAETIDVTGTDVLTEVFGKDDIAPVVEAPVAAAPEAPVAAEPEVAAEEPAAPEEPVAAEEPVVPTDPKVPTGFVPIPVHAELRAKARKTEETLRQQLSASQIAQARAEARAEVLAEMAAKGQKPETPNTPPAPKEKSPLEKFAEEFPGEAVTASVMLEQRTWDNQQVQVKANQTHAQTLGQQINEGLVAARSKYSPANMGVDLAFDAVIALAEQHGLITPETKASFAPLGRHAGSQLYEFAKNVIRDAGGVPLQELNRRIVVARQTLANRDVKPNKPTNPPVKPVVPVVPAGKKPTNQADVSGITNFVFRK
jgi:hypothetical protein